MTFDWDPIKAEQNFKDHGIRFEEATEIFGDPNMLDEFDGMHSETEKRYLAIGLSTRRLLVVSFTEIGDLVHIISARKAGPKAKRTYEKG